MGLTIREASIFEERTGEHWEAAIRRRSAQICKLHRVRIQGCRACQRNACAEHASEIEECAQCVSPSFSAREWAAMDYIVRLRTDPEADYDEDIDLQEAMVRAGELFSAREETGSSGPSTSDGSPRSSTGSRGSRSRGTKHSR
jgi:hypothetical protein